MTLSSVLMASHKKNIILQKRFRIFSHVHRIIFKETFLEKLFLKYGNVKL